MDTLIMRINRLSENVIADPEKFMNKFTILQLYADTDDETKKVAFLEHIACSELTFCIAACVSGKDKFPVYFLCKKNSTANLYTFLKEGIDFDIRLDEINDILTFEKKKTQILYKLLFTETAIRMQKGGLVRKQKEKVNVNISCMNTSIAVWKKGKDQLTTLVYSVSPNRILDIHVETYTKLDILFKYYTKSELQKYISQFIYKGGLLQRVWPPNFTDTERYVKKQFPGVKNTVPFYHVNEGIDKNKKQFEKTKMHKLFEFIERYNYKNKEYGTNPLTFDELTYEKKMFKNKEYKSIVCNHSSSKIYYVDFINDATYTERIHSVVQELARQSDATITQAHDFAEYKTALYYVFLHEKKWYEDKKIEDDKKRIPVGCIKQLVTLENFLAVDDHFIGNTIKEKNAACTALIAELSMKECLRTKSALFFLKKSKQCNSLISKVLYFYLENKERIYELALTTENWTFDIKETKSLELYDTFEGIYTLLAEEFATTNKNMCIGLIKDRNTSFALLRGDFYPIPDTKFGTFGKNKDNHNIDCIVDLNFIDLKYNGKDIQSYISSERNINGYIMENAPHIYMLYPIGQTTNTMSIHELRFLLDTKVVHKGFPTTIPFPFKLLREYIEIYS